MITGGLSSPLWEARDEEGEAERRPREEGLRRSWIRDERALFSAQMTLMHESEKVKSIQDYVLCDSKLIITAWEILLCVILHCR